MGKFILNPSLYIKKIETGIVVNVAGKESITIEGNCELFLVVLDSIDGTKDTDDIHAKLSNRSDYDFLEVNDIIRFSINENIIKMGNTQNSELLDNYEHVRYSRQLKSFLSGNGMELSDAHQFQRKLSDSHVVILGVGGVGGYLALSCAMIGINKITLIDSDLVELSNVTRQVLYDESEIGSNKVDIAKIKLLRKNKKCNVHAITKQVEDTEDLNKVLNEAHENNGEIDIIIVSADTPRGELPYILDECCYSAGIPYLMCGPYGGTKLFVGPLIDKNSTKSYNEYFPKSLFLQDEIIDSINSGFQSAIIDPYNALAAKVSTLEIMKFITGFSEPKVLGKMIDFNTNTWEVEHYDL